MQSSIGSTGDALSNALMESTIGLYTELIDLEMTHRWTGRNELERETADWVKWFNHEQLHSAIDYRPPIEYEEMCRSNQATEPEAA